MLMWSTLNVNKIVDACFDLDEAALMCVKESLDHFTQTCINSTHIFRFKCLVWLLPSGGYIQF